MLAFKKENNYRAMNSVTDTGTRWVTTARWQASLIRRDSIFLRCDHAVDWLRVTAVSSDRSAFSFRGKHSQSRILRNVSNLSIPRAGSSEISVTVSTPRAGSFEMFLKHFSNHRSNWSPSFSSKTSQNLPDISDLLYESSTFQRHIYFYARNVAFH